MANPPNGQNPQKGRRRRGGRRGRGARRSMRTLWLELAVCGVVPDMKMTTKDLVAARDMALLALPGKPGEGRLTSYVEIFSTMLVSTGVSPNDAIEMIRLMAGTSQALHWSEIPDFDPGSENNKERSLMRMSGARFGAAYDAAQRLRKAVSKEESKDDKKVAAFKSQFAGHF